MNRSPVHIDIRRVIVGRGRSLFNELLVLFLAMMILRLEDHEDRDHEKNGDRGSDHNPSFVLFEFLSFKDIPLMPLIAILAFRKLRLEKIMIVPEYLPAIQFQGFAISDNEPAGKRSRRQFRVLIVFQGLKDFDVNFGRS